MPGGYEKKDRGFYMSRQKNIIEVVTIQIKNGVSETHFLKLSHAALETATQTIEFREYNAVLEEEGSEIFYLEEKA